jgi:hypothetical protein
MRSHLAFILDHAETDSRLEVVSRRLDRFADSWAALWAQFGTSDQGLPAYRRELAQSRADLAAAGANEISLKNELKMIHVLDQLVFVPAIA